MKSESKPEEITLSADEVAVFDLKDAKDASKILESINKRYEQVYDAFLS